MKTHKLSEADQAFRAAFETCAISPDGFNHEAHLRLAYVYLVEYGSDGAHQRMREALLAFLAHYRIPATKFHETLTRAWVLAVSHFMSKSASASFSEFGAQSQPLFDSKAMLTHYSAETLFSPEARVSYVEPDLEAIPVSPLAS